MVFGDEGTPGKTSLERFGSNKIRRINRFELICHVGGKSLYPPKFLFLLFTSFATLLLCGGFCFGDDDPKKIVIEAQWRLDFDAFGQEMVTTSSEENNKFELLDTTRQFELKNQIKNRISEDVCNKVHQRFLGDNNQSHVRKAEANKMMKMSVDKEEIQNSVRKTTDVLGQSYKDVCTKNNGKHLLWFLAGDSKVNIAYGEYCVKLGLSKDCMDLYQILFHKVVIEFDNWFLKFDHRCLVGEICQRSLAKSGMNKVKFENDDKAHSGQRTPLPFVVKITDTIKADESAEEKKGNVWFKGEPQPVVDVEGKTFLLKESELKKNVQQRAEEIEKEKKENAKIEEERKAKIEEERQARNKLVQEGGDDSQGKPPEEDEDGNWHGGKVEEEEENKRIDEENKRIDEENKRIARAEERAREAREAAEEQRASVSISFSDDDSR